MGNHIHDETLNYVHHEIMTVKNNNIEFKITISTYKLIIAKINFILFKLYRIICHVDGLLK